MAKAEIDASTLLVYLFSNDQYVHQYEIDLVKAINQGEKGLFQMGISESKEVSFALNLQIVLSEDQKKLMRSFYPYVMYYRPSSWASISHWILGYGRMCLRSTKPSPGWFRGWRSIPFLLPTS